MRSLLIGATCLLAVCAASANSEQFSVNRIVYQEKSLYRNIIVVEGDGYRCMKFGRLHARQTCIEIANPTRLVLNYTQGLLTGLYISAAPRRVLVLGLGGGVLPMALRTLDRAMEIDTVELDPAVVKVAQSHFVYREDARSRVHVDDARVFIRKQRRQGAYYDLIIIDAFDKDYIPEHLLTREFLEEVKSLLSPSGAVAANTFTKGPLAQHEAATYQAVFGNVFKVDMDGGNRIILARRDRLPSISSIRGVADRLDSLLQPLGASSDDLLPRIRPQAQATGARVLTDQFSPANLLLLSP